MKKKTAFQKGSFFMKMALGCCYENIILYTIFEKLCYTIFIKLIFWSYHEKFIFRLENKKRIESI